MKRPAARTLRAPEARRTRPRTSAGAWTTAAERIHAGASASWASPVSRVSRGAPTAAPLPRGTSFARQSATVPALTIHPPSSAVSSACDPGRCGLPPKPAPLKRSLGFPPPRSRRSARPRSDRPAPLPRCLRGTPREPRRLSPAACPAAPGVHPRGTPRLAPHPPGCCARRSRRPRSSPRATPTSPTPSSRDRGSRWR